MSKTRFDRAKRIEEWKSDYTPLTGGFDQSSSALAVKPGRLVAGLNMEEVFGQQGYSFVKGYERFSGQPSPSRIYYVVQLFNLGTTGLAVGSWVTSPSGARAYITRITILSGSLGAGDAVGELLMTLLEGSWELGDPLQVLGNVTVAVATDISQIGSPALDDHEGKLKQVREHMRDLIGQPPGSGAILGGAVFDKAVYVVRNNEAGTSATLWRSTFAGWSVVRNGLHANGAYKFKAANFSGATDRLALYGVSGRGRLFEVRKDGTVTFAQAIWGSEATSTTSMTIGLGAKALTIAQPARDWYVTQPLTVWDQANSANSMSGTVTAYNPGTGDLQLNVTSTTGSGISTTWEIGRPDFSDKPYLLTEHKDHLFLAYRQGQLQTSNLGEPLVASTTAALFGVGQEITDLCSLKGKALAIFCTQKIDVLEGSSSLNWDKGTYSDNTGAIMGTVQDNAGNALFLDTKGLTSLQATQAFGDLESSIFSRDVKKSLDQRVGFTVGSRMARGNYQYRLYFTDGAALRFTLMTGNPVVTPRDVSPSLSQYKHVPSCLFSGVMDDGAERMFFGTTDGWVMEEDVGTSYDGEAIYYAIRLPFNHFKNPAQDKQFHKMELELTCPDPMTFNYRQLFDYEDGMFGFGAGEALSPGEGGQFDVDAFDSFYFDLPVVSRVETSIDGQGRNMALMFWAESDFARPATLQGILTYFSLQGVRR
jgi:hypothetical protein